MKAYGVKRKDKTCCAGHSKFAKLDNERGKKFKPRSRPAKKRARRKAKDESSIPRF